MDVQGVCIFFTFLFFKSQNAVLPASGQSGNSTGMIKNADAGISPVP
jgi:hypothetical protein